MLQDIASKLYAAALLCKFYHWNIRGEGFHPLHKLLDEVHELLEGMADDVAERQVALGTAVNVTPATITKAFASPSDGFVACAAAIDAVDDLLAGALSDLRTKWDGGVDVVTANFLQECAMQLQKYRWLLMSHKLPVSEKKAAAPATAALRDRVAELLNTARSAAQETVDDFD